MSLTASARSIAGSLRNEVDVNGRHTITTDEPESLGGTDKGPAPHELLPAMLASCVSTMIVLYAQRRDWQLGDVRVDVTYDADSTPRHVEIAVHLPEGLTHDQVERLTRVAQTCPARRALEAGFTFEERLVLDRPAVGLSWDPDDLLGRHHGRAPSISVRARPDLPSAEPSSTACLDPRQRVEHFGRTNYEIMLCDCLWHVYAMLGKLHRRAYASRAPSATSEGIHPRMGEGPEMSPELTMPPGNQLIW